MHIYKTISAFALGISIVGCDRSGNNLIPQPNGEFPAVIDVGEMAVIDTAQLQEIRSQGSGSKAWCDQNTDAEGRRLCYYGLLGQAPAGVKGGATFTFRGTGEDVCVIVDPETVFWNASVAASNPNLPYAYNDLEEDDGDIDLFAGLSSYYTGSPGIELGDFKGFYTDSLGKEIEIEYGECIQYGARQGMNNAHAGRAAAEFCTINTENREDVLYTVVLESFSIPLSDGALGFGAVVVNGQCGSDRPVDECTLYGEGLIEQRDEEGSIKYDEATGEMIASARACTVQLEAAACADSLHLYCCEYPLMCGEDADRTICENLEESLPAELSCPSYCDVYDDSQNCEDTSEDI